MNKTLLPALFSWLTAAALFGQSPGDLNSGTQLVHDPDTNSFTFSWWGEAGRIYYLQQSEDLKKWDYLPVTEIGTSNILSWGFTTTADRLFLRLKHTELQGSPTEMDSDGDSIPDWEEIQDNTDPFDQDTDDDGWYDDEEQRSNTNPRDEEDKPVLKPMEQYVTVESRWVNAGWTQSGGNKAYATWSWSWYSDDPPAGSWVLSSSGEYPVLPVNGGYATFSDGREFAELSGLGEARGKLDELSEMETGWAPSLGPWMVGSSYSEVSQGSDPGYPTETPNYPDLGSSSAEWLVEPYKSWNGGAVELRLAWTSDAPRMERRTQVAVALQTQQIENGDEMPMQSADLLIRPEDEYSMVGGSGGYGLTLAKANTATAGAATTTKITQYDIKPAANMRGVVGDIVYSAKQNSTIQHFVTPKKTALINDPFVELEAVGINAATFTSKFEWEGGMPGGASNTRKVSRDNTGKTIVNIKAKRNGAIVAQMIVWVVWCDLKDRNPAQCFPIIDKVSVGTRGSKITGIASFIGDIAPAEIVDLTKEIPDLRGTPSTDVPEVKNGPHPLDALRITPPGPGAKWDVSRRWKARSMAPNTSGDDLDINSSSSMYKEFQKKEASGIIHKTTPSAGSDHYPTNPIEGNDYKPLTQDPYGTTPGKLVDLDSPITFAKTRSGVVGHNFEIKYNFGEFARLEIGGKWYLISGYVDWHYHVRMRKASEALDGVDHNGDGDMVDEVWINNGSTCDYTDPGF